MDRVPGAAPSTSTVVLSIDGTRIDCAVRYSARARRLRVTVKPDGVEVVVPAGTPRDGPRGIDSFLSAKSRWILRHHTQMAERRGSGLAQAYSSGSRLLYRGRRLEIDVRRTDVTSPVVTCPGRFVVEVPWDRPGKQLDEPLDDIVRSALHAWMRDRADEDSRRWVAEYCDLLGVQAKGVRLSKAKTRWGSCNRKGVVRVNWRLVQAPSDVMEYVVAHEVCHLLVRNHSDRFWATLGRVMPDWPLRKARLREWEREQLVEGRDL
ncbi:MAG: M48 family metallopeptidase [Anaerolineae bacterium]